MSKLLLFAAALSTAVISGCASKASCLHNHKITTGKTDSALVRISYVDVLHEGDTLTVSGAVKGSGQSSQSTTAHLDISVLDEQGKLIKQAKSDEIHVPRRQIGNGPGFVRFKVIIPMDVQQNITVHAQPHTESSCEIIKPK